MKKPAILVVDDDAALRELITLRLEANGFKVEAVDSGEAALAQLALARPDAVLTDMQMGGIDGMALFRAIHARDPSLPVIVLTAHGTIPDAVAATQQGLFGYLTKPYDAPTLVDLLKRATRLAGSSPETHDDSWRSDIVTASPAMDTLLAEARLAAQIDAALMIQGESGTGKELLARAIHRASPRHAKPFVAINCGAIPAELLESELFGHVKGAFTGAGRDHPGLFLSAQGGTVFLDEIGELQPAVQATLLGVLERRRVRRLGSRAELPVDVRVVAATHRDLRSEVNGGTFRLDLFYRLAVVGITLPPLRERVEDIPLLIEHFLRDCGWTQPTSALISPSVMDGLCRHHFAGNVRELRNLVEAAVAMGEAPPLPAPGAAAPRGEALAVDLAAPYKEARAALLDDFEARYVAALLERAGGNVSAAARMARMARSHLNELLTKQRRT